MRRRNLLALTGLAAVSPAALTTPAAAADGMGHTAVRPEDIEQIHAASRTLAEWDNLYGGGIVREVAGGQLERARSLLQLPCPPRLHAELHTAVGRLAIVMGASLFDSFWHDEARDLFDLGTWCAENAGNWHLRAAALNWRARQAIWIGAPDEGLTHAQNGLIRSDRLTPREQAMLHNAGARAWARMGDRQECLAAVGRSDDAFASATNDQDEAWMAYYDAAQHHGDTGHALFDIALQSGHPAVGAEGRLQTAIHGHTSSYVRSRALSGTKLATLMMATGDPAQAVAVGNRALDEVGRLRSKRAIADVQALRQASDPYRRYPEVIALRERITATVKQ
ncbi:hypothetical protein ACODT5_02735 [Streptomyces sp. 5.8]|uniref:hypothetical protein n=1 Tax=Streptomyces sp. 5.8 TaxID=3406571 RepID=UPI003BB66755